VGLVVEKDEKLDQLMRFLKELKNLQRIAQRVWVHKLRNDLAIVE
jgi:hypothetical protein